MRLLAAVRLSDETDETTSPERQLARIQSYASAYGHEVIGPAIDLDVSGAVSPFDRPQLGPWLARPDEWDGLAVAKFDRLSRNVRDFSNLCQWLTEHGKVLVCLDPAIDLSTPAGRSFAQMLAVFAEFERAMIAERVRDAWYHLRRGGKYPGGAVPFGLRAVRSEPKGWQLVPDPEYAPVLREMVSRYLSGKSMRSIANWLNSERIPASRDAQRVRSGKRPQGKGWTQASVRTVLMGPALSGHVATRRGAGSRQWEPLRDGDELAVTIEPLISAEDYGRLLAAQEARRPSARSNASKLLGVVFCGRCGATMHATFADGGRYVYYRCRSSIQGGCGVRLIRAAWLETVVPAAFLALAGDAEITEPVVTPAEDHSAELARVAEAIEHLETEYVAGRLYAGTDGLARFTALLARLEQRRDSLAALPSAPARTDYRPTGQTFRQRWTELDTDGRRLLMAAAGYRAEAEMAGPGRLRLRLVIDPDLPRRAALAASGRDDAQPWPPEMSEANGAVRAGINLYLVPDDDITERIRAAIDADSQNG